MPSRISRSLLALLVAMAIATQAHAQQLGWILPGQADEQAIKSRPKESLYGKLNSNMLVITTQDSTPILSPYRGVIRKIEYKYWHDFQRATTWRMPPMRTIEERKAHLAALARANGFEQKAIAASVTLDSAGYSITISGLLLRWSIRVGMQIKRGDTLGNAGRFLSDINEPNVAVAIQEYGVSGNPLVLFGIDVEQQVTKTKGVKRHFTPAEIQEDLAVLRHIIQKANPNAFVYITPQQFDSAYSQMLRGSRVIRNYNWLHKQCMLLGKIALDERTNVRRPASNALPKPTHRYPALFGVLRDSLIITWTHPSLSRFVGRYITMVDGFEADSIVRYIKHHVNGSIGVKAPGGYTEGTNQRIAFLAGGLLYYAWHRPYGSPHSVSFELDDGTIMAYPPLTEDLAYGRDIPPSFAEYIDASGEGSATVRLLDPMCGYLGLPSLDSARSNLSEIAAFVRQLQRNRVESLIIDLRGAEEGQVEVAQTLFALIAKRPFRPYAYRETTRQNAYQFFTNPRLEPDSIPAPKHYKKIGDNHHFRLEGQELIPHDSIYGYQGRIYVLINEMTHGPASLLASLVRRERRGAFVGRETGSAYYTLATDPDYAITLPNIRLRVRVPLGRVVFDTLLHESQPWGRGVLPDYEFPLSIREFTDPKADTLLQYALQLALEDQYPVEIVEADSRPYHVVLASVASIAMALAIALYLLKREKQGRKGRENNTEHCATKPTAANKTDEHD